MRILFTLGDAFLPQRSGGVQSSTDQLARALRRRGHIVAVACSLTPGGWIAASSKMRRKLGRSTFSRDSVAGYPVYRAWDPSDLSEVVRRFKPDVAVVQNGHTVAMAESVERHGVPVLVYFRNVEFDELGGSLNRLTTPGFIANSAFTASRVKHTLGYECAVVRPFVDADRYRTISSKENITFINPHPVKGADIAFAVAEKCPDIAFNFVESWPITSLLRNEINLRIAKLPNVTLTPRTTDMKAIYGKARILLAPSVWEEAWGRVATEAHFSGIPVIGSRQGGLSEAIGPGGITLDVTADVAEWVAAVRALWDSEAECARLGRAALEFSKRPEMTFGHQVEQLEKLFEDRITSCTLAETPGSKPMRILFTMGDSYFPQRGGGAQSNTDQLASALMAAGHDVALACTLSGGGWTEKRSRVIRRLSGSTFSRDSFNGYAVYRAWDPTDLTEVVAKFAPDVAIVQNGFTVKMAKSLEGLGVPTIVYFHNVEFDDLVGDPRDLVDAAFLSNSEFTARRVMDVYGLPSTVIRPLVDAALYRTSTTRENVTFINPYAVKGADIAFDVAERCPDIPFAFVESWGIDPPLRAALDRRLAGLPNVKLQPRTTDMKTVYAKARLLLAPSRWEEAWGRVATEAQFSGIPVVGSRQGGLPEAIGPGGITVPVDADIAEWVAAVRRLWDDEPEFARLSAAALAFSQRPEIQPHVQTGQLIEVLKATVAATRSPAATGAAAP